MHLVFSNERAAAATWEACMTTGVTVVVAQRPPRATEAHMRLDVTDVEDALAACRSEVIMQL